METVIEVRIVPLRVYRDWRIRSFGDGKVAVIIDTVIEGTACFSHIECRAEGTG